MKIIRILLILITDDVLEKRGPDFFFFFPKVMVDRVKVILLWTLYREDSLGCLVRTIVNEHKYPDGLSPQGHTMKCRGLVSWVWVGGRIEKEGTREAYKDLNPCLNIVSLSFHFRGIKCKSSLQLSLKSQQMWAFMTN